MLKHVREALRRAGIPPGAATVRQRKSGHFWIVVGGRRVACSGSPKDRDTAAMRIARDLGNKKAPG